MIAQTPQLAGSAQLAERGNPSLTRILGTIGMVTSPFLLISFIIEGPEQGTASTLSALLGLVFALGWLSNVVGLYTLRAAGPRFGRYILGAEVVGVTIACGFNVFEAVSPGNTSILYTITDISWPLSMLILLITGIAAIRARVLPGFLRFAPLIAALWLPTTMALGAVVGPTIGLTVAGVHVMIGWFLMGLAVVRTGLAARD